MMNISWGTALLVFGLKDNFTPSELKSRYRSLSKITHPDTGGDEDLFKFITACKEILEKPKADSSNTSSEKTSSYTNNNSKASSQNAKEVCNIKLKTLYDIYYDLSDYTDKYDIQIIHTQIDVTSIFKRDRFNKVINLNKLFKDFEESGFIKFPTVIIQIPKGFNRYRKLKVEVIFLGEKYKFNITKKNRFHTIECSHVRFDTYIPFEFRW